MSTDFDKLDELIQNLKAYMSRVDQVLTRAKSDGTVSTSIGALNRRLEAVEERLRAIEKKQAQQNGVQLEQDRAFNHRLKLWMLIIPIIAVLLSVFLGALVSHYLDRSHHTEQQKVEAPVGSGRVLQGGEK